MAHMVCDPPGNAISSTGRFWLLKFIVLYCVRLANSPRFSVWFSWLLLATPVNLCAILILCTTVGTSVLVINFISYRAFCAWVLWSSCDLDLWPLETETTSRVTLALAIDILYIKFEVMSFSSDCWTWTYDVKNCCRFYNWQGQPLCHLDALKLSVLKLGARDIWQMDRRAGKIRKMAFWRDGGIIAF